MESREISFVTWPDGKVSDASLTVAGEQNAKERHIGQWLPKEWFGKPISSFQAMELFRGMEEKGFRIHTIVIGKDGSPKLKE